MLKIDEAHLRNLSCLWAPSLLLSFTLDPVSHHVSLYLIPNFPFATWQCHCWLLDCVEVCNLWECCPRGSHSVISRLLTGGALVSALCSCCFLAHRLLYGIFVVCYSLLFYFAIPIPRVIQCYHLFWYFSNNYELTSWSPAVLFLFCVLFCFCFFLCGFCFAFALLFLWLSCVGWLSLHGDCSMDYASILIQFYFWCTLSIWWFCHCFNSLNL